MPAFGFHDRHASSSAIAQYPGLIRLPFANGRAARNGGVLIGKMYGQVSTGPPGWRDALPLINPNRFHTWLLENRTVRQAASSQF
jgi:hypothetical protein